MRRVLAAAVFSTTLALSMIAMQTPAQACTGSNGMRAWVNIQYNNLMYGPNCYSANTNGHQYNVGVSPENAMSSAKNNNAQSIYCGVDTMGIFPSVTVIILYPNSAVNDFRSVPGAQDSIDQFDIIQTHDASCPAPS